MSSLIFNQKKLLGIQNPDKYVGSYFIHSYLAFESTAHEEGNLGIIALPCIAKYSPKWEEDRSQDIFFEAFGINLHTLLCDIAVKCGYDKSQMTYICKQFIYKAFVSKILFFKSCNDVDWKDKYWKYGYPAIKKYPDAWIKVMPVLLVPGWLAKIILKIKSLIKKYKQKNN